MPFLRYSKLDNDFDNGAFADGENTFESEVFNPGASINYFKGKLGVNTLYNFVKTERVFNSSFGEAVLDGRTHTADIFAHYELSQEFKFIGGIYGQRAEVIDDGATETDPSFDTFSPYISFLMSGFKRINAELGYRLNHHSIFGSEPTYSAAVSYGLPLGLTAFGSYTTGFKSPTLSELFDGFFGDPDLNPETSVSYEGGLMFNLLNEKLTGQATYFNRSVDDVIFFDPNTGYENRDEQHDYGVEAELTYRILSRLSLTAIYNYLNGEITVPTNAEETTTFFNLIRRPRHSYVVTLNAQLLDNLSVSLQGQYYGDRTDEFTDPVTWERQSVDLDAYLLLNAYVEYQAIDKLSFFADFKNITDTDFVESTGFSTLGFNLQTGIHFNL